MARLDGKKSSKSPLIVGLLVLAVLVLGAYFLLFNRATRVADVDADVDVERVDRSAPMADTDADANRNVNANTDANAGDAGEVSTPPAVNSTRADIDGNDAATNAPRGAATAGSTGTGTTPAGTSAAQNQTTVTAPQPAAPPPPGAR